MGTNIAFYGYNVCRHTIDEAYSDGISITHGTPRTHIWTFASPQVSGTCLNTRGNERCPCYPGNVYSAPPFVGDDYFCVSVAESDNWRESLHYFYYDTPAAIY